jgi:hypothetical protein
MTERKPNGAGPNRPILKWGAFVLGIALAGLAVFLFAAWLFPGRSDRFYEIFALATAGVALLVRLLTLRAR